MNAIKLILSITPVIYVMANFESDFEKKYKGQDINHMFEYQI